jgi:hypothetical protein
MMTRFTIAIHTVLPPTTPANEAANNLLYTTAHECDALAEFLAMGAAEMARRFTEYGADVTAGRFAALPTGYSTIREMEQSHAVYESKAEGLYRLVVVLLGDDAAAKYREALRPKA